jgi:tetratricopeptide (TPR) repeat protein/tRNA A-37 threonylcarbamoyl transferase component Bud32
MTNKCPKCHHDNPDTKQFCGDCGTQLPSIRDIEVTETIETPKEELTRGTTFAGRYEIIEELGKGGMGRVYRVEDTKLKQEVALKLIKPEIAKDKKTIERFRNELKLARNIRHKNVCGMFDLGETEGASFITMEYVRGEDLKSFIRRSGLISVGKAISIANQVCEGLSEAHRLGVVHRDLKPQNIMIDKEGNVRIMDFGIARSLEARGITASGMIIGTPEYMSPEQVEAKEVDQRSDIYSLGIILYEMTTGRLPFEADTPFAVGVKQKSEEPESPRDINPQIPEDLSRVILRCLEKDRDARYQSVGEVRSELVNIEKGIPTTEREVPVRKPLTSKEITVQFSVKKIFIPAFIFAAVVIIGVIIWQVLPKKAAAPIPSDKPSIAVMYFENNTGDIGLEHYRKALSDLLIADLSQSKYIRVLRGDNLYNILNRLDQLKAKSYSSDVLKEVAERGRVNHILQGNYTRAGENFRINIMLHDANTEELIGSESVEGIGEASIFSMVDELTKKIKANFNLSQAEVDSDFDREVGKITTSSSEAYRYYNEGRKYLGEGDYQRSIELTEKAIEIDPEFAMAYRSLAMSYSNRGFYAERTQYIQKALELIDRLSDRERYLIQGDFYYGLEKTYDKAVEAYTRLLELYPDDWIGNTNIAVVYRNIEEWDKAIEHGETLVKNKDWAVVVYTGLASAYRAKGMYDKAREVLEGYIHNVSDNAAIHRALSTTYGQQGEYDLAQKEVDKAFLLDPTSSTNIRYKGNIYFYQGDLKRAEEEYRKLLNEKEPLNIRGNNRLLFLNLYQGRFRDSMGQAKTVLEIARRYNQNVWIRNILIVMAYLESNTGDHEKALERLNEIWDSAVEDEDIYDQRIVLFRKGFTYLNMKSVDEAQKMADAHRKMCEVSMNKRTIRDYYHLQGRIELERENYAKAVEYIKKALSLLSETSGSRMAITNSLALAYYKSGDLGQAKREYERMSTFHTGRITWGDIYAKSFYMVGKIYEEQGDTAKATEHYEKFLDLWKDADLGIAEVEDVKKRLAGLKNQ